MVKVADFGIARIQDQSGVMTAETGTYRWMAPEVGLLSVLIHGCSPSCFLVCYLIMLMASSYLATIIVLQNDFCGLKLQELPKKEKSKKSKNEITRLILSFCQVPNI